MGIGHTKILGPGYKDKKSKKYNNEEREIFRTSLPRNNIFILVTNFIIACRMNI